MIHQIEFLSTRTSGVKFTDEEKWRTVTGNAANYLSNLSKGDKVDIKLDDNGNVIYISPVKEVIKEETETVDHMETSLDGIYGILGDISSQLKQFSRRMDRIEEKLNIENEVEFKKATE